MSDDKRVFEQSDHVRNLKALYREFKTIRHERGGRTEITDEGAAALAAAAYQAMAADDVVIVLGDIADSLTDLVTSDVNRGALH